MLAYRHSSATDMTQEQRRNFMKRAECYHHILELEAGYRKVARRFRHDKASGMVYLCMWWTDKAGTKGHRTKLLRDAGGHS
ncbi:hypothetical protein NDU88_005176 [Pleurodeles waltl]|uniref:Transposase n=1 Tax=Pleurodeles waltl TaxID=8319 RepID=A0AAV7TAV1_PLEWA|nr:hypothetical protein NDU88_005176 [Pleurodeles waltl]